MNANFLKFWFLIKVKFYLIFPQALISILWSLFFGYWCCTNEKYSNNIHHFKQSVDKSGRGWAYSVYMCMYDLYVLLMSSTVQNFQKGNFTTVFQINCSSVPKNVPTDDKWFLKVDYQSNLCNKSRIIKNSLRNKTKTTISGPCRVEFLKIS